MEVLRAQTINQRPFYHYYSQSFKKLSCPDLAPSVLPIILISSSLSPSPSFIYFFSSLLFFKILILVPHFDRISRTASCLMQSNTHTNVPHNVTDCGEIEEWSDGVSGEDKEVCRAQYVDKVMISPSLLPC